MGLSLCDRAATSTPNWLVAMGGGAVQCGDMQDTIGEILVAIPKPRGEGAWAWVRYHLIRVKGIANGEETCTVVGCPHSPVGHWPGVCERHLSPERRTALDKRTAAARAEFERRKAAGMIPRRTFCQWLGISRPLR